MFDIFGEFNTYEEINEAALGQREEGDKKALEKLAAENGIELEVVELFMLGEIDFICDCESAAFGKLDVEAAELKPQEIMQDWIEYIKVCVSKEEKMARAVRSKGKTLKGCIAELLTWSFKNAYKVDSEITKAAGVQGECKLGIPGMGTAKRLIREYYLGKKA